MPKGIYIHKQSSWNKGLKGAEYEKHYPNGHNPMKKGTKLSIETRKKMSKNNICYWKGKNIPKEAIIKRTKTRIKNGNYIVKKSTKLKSRIARQKYILKTYGGPTIGRNESQILDELELSINYKIIRQYSICGYSVDGYISELNLVIEIDEIHHKNNKEKDSIRQKNIIQTLECDFIRIEDYIRQEC